MPREVKPVPGELEMMLRAVRRASGLMRQAVRLGVGGSREGAMHVFDEASRVVATLRAGVRELNASQDDEDGRKQSQGRASGGDVGASPGGRGG